MVNLTQPVDLCFSKPEMKGDKAFQSYALEILSHQQAYKEAFGDEDFMACLAEKLKKLLEKVIIEFVTRNSVSLNLLWWVMVCILDVELQTTVTDFEDKLQFVVKYGFLTESLGIHHWLTHCWNVILKDEVQKETPSGGLGQGWLI